MDFTGYREAVIHLAWFRDDTVRYVLFGMVELRPTEFPDAVACAEKSIRAQGGSRKYLYYRRFALPAEKAIDWYQEAANGGLILPSDPDRPTQGDGAKLECSTFVQEPPWPHFVTSNDLVFAPDWMHGSRIHFLFPKKILSPAISEILHVDKNRTTLEEWLHFDIVNAYYDYQGALCLVAPNPIFRSIEKSVSEQARAGAAETVAYKLVARQGQRLEGLRLEVVNERLRGRMVPLVHEFDTDLIPVFDFPVEIYKEGLSITHPKHDLLSWHDPLPVVRTIHLTTELQRRRKRVQVPSDGRKRSEYTYDVEEFDEARGIVVGDALEDNDTVRRLTGAEHRRSRQQAAKDYDQQWFYDAPREAAEYVRQKIGGARDSVLVVDPYFAVRALLAYGHAIRRPDVGLRILTSAQYLKGKDANDPHLDSGLQLQEALNTTFEDYSIKPEIRLLTGESPQVHDRFLVVDGTVWLSGNSLHTIGERAGMIVRLPDPVPVIERLEAFWRGAPTLSDWLSNRAAASRKISD